MKKVLTFIIMALMLSTGVTAQDKYYYYDGNKIPLTEQTSKAVMIAQKTAVVLSNRNKVIQEIGDTELNIEVVERPLSIEMVKEISNLKYHMESCYKNMAGLELIPTGYINIELKQSTDYNMLRELASSYNLVIVGQNDFMPLWYSLRLDKDNDNSVIDIANAIYESGVVSSCSPDFSFDGVEISYDPDVLKQWGL